MRHLIHKLLFILAIVVWLALLKFFPDARTTGHKHRVRLTAPTPDAAQQKSDED